MLWSFNILICLQYSHAFLAILCTTQFGFTCIACILARVYSRVPFTDTWYVVGHRREDHQNNPADLVHGEGIYRKLIE